MQQTSGRTRGLTPDTDRLRELIKARGYRSVSAFARTRAKPRTLINVVCGGQRASEAYLRRIARSLGVDMSELVLDKTQQDDGDGQPDLAAAS